MHQSLSVKMLCASVLLAASPFGWSVTNERLWLPQEYRIHYIKLKEAALVVEALDQCNEILRGTLDLDLSTTEHSYYRFLCRQPDGVTYSEIVDGITLVPRSMAAEEPPPETTKELEKRLAREAAEAEQERQQAAERVRREEELARREVERAQQAAEQVRLAEERAAAEAEEKVLQATREAHAQAAHAAKSAQIAAQERAKRKQVFQQICHSEILARTSMMLNLVWITEQLIPVELDNGQMRFHGEFDAENIWGKKLEYEVECIISTPAEMAVIISAR